MTMPVRGRLLAGLLALLGGPASGHDGHHDEPGPPRPVPEVEAHRPTAIPDRIIRTFAGDPARSIAVTWRTDAGVGRALAQIATAEAGPKFGERARSVDAESVALETDLGPSRHHSVVFDGLEPATTYAYRVGDGVNWSEWVHARTASDRPEAFAFIYFGDAQNDIKSLWSRVVRGAYSEAPKAAFIIHAGDLVNRADRDAEWGEWFAAGGWINAMVPSVPTPGNHEYERPRAPGPTAEAEVAKSQDRPATEPRPRAELSRHWRPQFALPPHGPAGLEETVYYVDYQGTRVVCLNSNEAHEAQAAWLEGVLADNPNTWTVITFHHPIFSSAKDRDDPVLRDLWQPVFDRYKVDLVLQGHDHTYARSGLHVHDNAPTGADRRLAGEGTVYVVSVSGPKMYALDRQEWMRRAAEDTQLYQIIAVDGGTLRYEARTAVGDLYDAFELRKRPGLPNELIEHIPEAPERRRRPAAEPRPRPDVQEATPPKPR